MLKNMYNLNDFTAPCVKRKEIHKKYQFFIFRFLLIVTRSITRALTNENIDEMGRVVVNIPRNTWFDSATLRSRQVLIV